MICLKRYIDRNALLKRLCNDNPSAMEDYYYNAIKNAPKADVVEVVRCKDCEYYLDDTKYCKLKNVGYCELDDVVKAPFDYCSYGERKEK